MRCSYYYNGIIVVETTSFVGVSFEINRIPYHTVTVTNLSMGMCMSMSDPFEEQEPAGVAVNSNKAIEIRNGVATLTLVESSEVAPNPDLEMDRYHDSVTDADVVGFLHSSLYQLGRMSRRDGRDASPHCASLQVLAGVNSSRTVARWNSWRVASCSSRLISVTPISANYRTTLVT
jgi:hypothetical protein